MDWIKEVVDNALREMSRKTILMMVPGDIPSDMIDQTIQPMDDWRGWRPSDSTITDRDIQQFEKKIGLNLPLSYKQYLKYKHFFSLRLPDIAVNLFKHLPDEALRELNYHVFDSYEPELIIGRKYIYIADFHDYGLLCFDANANVQDNEYRVVYMDHENLEDVHVYADNFRNLMEADSEKGSDFIDKLNDYYK